MKLMWAKALKRIQRSSLSLYSPHTERSPTCIWITICWVDSLHQMFLSAFCLLQKEKKNLFTNLNVHERMLDSMCVCVCMSVPMCEHACPCFRGQEWRCYPLVIHHKRDTLSPALRYAEAMFYKRITRQRAPTGHPLPPCATCKDVQWTHRSHALSANPACGLHIQEQPLSCFGGLIWFLFLLALCVWFVLRKQGEAEDGGIG